MRYGGKKKYLLGLLSRIFFNNIEGSGASQISESFDTYTI